MEYASEKTVRNILTQQFGIDIRETEFEGERYTVTFDKDGEPTVVCRWGELPEGRTVNDSREYWVRVWTKSTGPLPITLWPLVNTFFAKV